MEALRTGHIARSRDSCTSREMGGWRFSVDTPRVQEARHDAEHNAASEVGSQAVEGVERAVHEIRGG